MPLKDTKIYLDRMSRPLQEKLRVAKYIPKNASSAVDVGCADGTVTVALAKLFPQTNFLGIDLREEFIDKAKEKAKKENVGNVAFEKVYLRDLLARSDRYDAITFISVLHEFYTYGEGISSVLKALADAHELLNIDGEVIIRDMILNEYTKNTTFQVDEILSKVRGVKDLSERVSDFEKCFGSMNSIYTLNHFLLKYFYIENWEYECAENYVPVTFEQYKDMFFLLGMDLQLQDSYLIEFLKNKWKDDFNLSDDEMAGLRSTGFLVARKK